MTAHEQLLLLAQEAAAQGSHEIAYCLYSKAAATASQPASQSTPEGLILQQCTSGRLQMLLQLCSCPPETAAVSTLANSTLGPPHQCQQQSSDQNSRLEPLNHREGALSLRWKVMQDRCRLKQPNASVVPCSLPQQTPRTKPQANDFITDFENDSCLGMRSDKSGTNPVMRPASLCTSASIPISQVHSSRPAAAVPSASPAPGRSHACRPMRRIFCVSDLHVDAAGGANLAWVRSISGSLFRQDLLIVAGERRAG